jgi:urease accessory protein UreH/urease accessory protein UreF
MTNSAATTSVRTALQKSVKHGFGRLTASADGGAANTNTKTRLTRVSHKAPTRLLPMTGKSSVFNAGAAVCALSNYGGGMLQGDSTELSVKVQANARLGVITQGVSRIYKRKTSSSSSSSSDGNSSSNNDCRATLEAELDENAFLVLAPDPCSLFARSSFVQRQTVRLHPTSSLALIDWFSSGRYRNGEAWDFDRLTSITRLCMHDEIFLQDATMMDLRIRSSSNTNNTKNINKQYGGDPLVGISDCHAFASLLLYGEEVELVKERCLELQDQLAVQTTRIRRRPPLFSSFEDDGTNNIAGGGGDAEAMLQSLAGKVYMGVSRVEVPHHPHGKELVDDDTTTTTAAAAAAAHVVRLGATTNEDIYRIFHYCLQPLSPKFGMEFYKDRIRAKASEIPHLSKPASRTIISKKVHWNNNNDNNNTTANGDDKNNDKEATTRFFLDGLKNDPSSESSSLSSSSSSSLWSAYMLADSSMPTGSFAHSAGLEAAAQLGMIQNEDDVESFIQAATRSTMQVTIPFLLQGYRLATTTTTTTTNNNNNNHHHHHDNNNNQTQSQFTDSLSDDWKQLDAKTQAVLVSNAPACAASLDQGKSLARVARQWLWERKDDDDESNVTTTTTKQLVLECLWTSDRNHIGPTLGAVAALLQLTPEQACRLFGYCVARDMVSAAVRLSLVGPLASVALLQKIQEAADVGLEASVRAIQDITDNSPADDYMAAAGASAPVIEAIHPCHDLLQTRLFRS